MKKHLSVFMLMVRGSFHLLLGIFCLMAVAETGIFWYFLNQAPTGISDSLELLVEESRVAWVFGFCFWLVCAALIRMGCVSGSQQGYTLRRLGISERQVFMWQSIYNALAFALFWLLQVLIALGLCGLYVRVAPENLVSGQTVFLAFYRSDFLHCLLPVEDTLVWVRNIAYVLALGLCSARYPMAVRRGRRFREALFLMCMCAASFVHELGSVASYLIDFSVVTVCVSISIYQVFMPEEEDYGEI